MCMVLRSVDDYNGDYTVPLTEKQEAAAHTLLTMLKAPNTPDTVRPHPGHGGRAPPSKKRRLEEEEEDDVEGGSLFHIA